MELKIDPSERMLIVAKTGAGKTEWAKYMLREVERVMPVVIIDPKELWLGRGKGGRPEHWAQKKELGTVDKPRLINEFNPKWRVQLLQPDVDGSEEDPRLPKLCYDIFKHGGGVFVYFDESEGIATATHVPAYIRKIWKTGRAHNIGAWIATQAPKGIPRIFKSQAEKFVALKVGEEDVDFVAQLVHSTKEEVAQLGRFEWLFYDSNHMDFAEWNAPIPFKEK
jgi:hypothetical protein